MKKILIKISPVLLIIILCLSYSFSQDETSEEIPEESITEVVKKEKSSKIKKKADEKKPVSEDQQQEDNVDETDEAEEEVEPVEENEVAKKVSLKTKPVQSQNIKKNIKFVYPLEIENGLLKLSPGDNLITRIPEIKLNNKKSSEVKDIVRIPDSLGETIGSSQNASGSDGFLGFSKEGTEIIAQISIVLLILLMFILYKTRSGGSSRRV